MSEKQSSPPPSALPKWTDRLLTFGHAVRSRMSGIFVPNLPEAPSADQKKQAFSAYRVSAERNALESAERLVERNALESAERLFGKDFVGPKHFEKAWGFYPENVPPIPFPHKLLVRAKKLGMILRLSVDRTPDGNPMTMKAMNTMQAESGRNLRVLYNTDWYKDEAFFKETSRAGWRLESKSVLNDSTGKNEVEQLELIVTHLQSVVFRGMTMPPHYEQAIAQFKAQKVHITTLMESATDWPKASAMIEALDLCQLTRATPVELIQAIETRHQNHEKGTFPYPNISVRTPRRNSEENLVRVSNSNALGVLVGLNRPGYHYSDLGVALSLQS